MTTSAGNAPHRRLARLRGRIRRSTGISAIALGIVVCAVVAPLVALRAADWGSKAAGADGSGLANLALSEEHYSQDVVKVDQDVRTYGSYAEIENRVIVLRRQAGEAARAGHRHLALGLYRQAQVDRSLAAGLRQGLRTTGLRISDARPSFAFSAALRGENGRDADLQAAQRTNDRLEADRAHAATTRLTGLATLWAAGLVFFTLAQIARKGTRARTILALAGLAVAAVAAAAPLVA